PEFAMTLLSLFGRPSRPAPIRRARLVLESLDGRFCPDINDPLNPGGGSDYLSNPPTDNPPVIIDFKATEVAPGMVTFTGTVVDEDPGGLTVTFHGPQVAIDGRTTVTHPDGTFSLTVVFRTDG